MEFKEFSFGQDDVDRRLDRIIRRFLPDSPLSEIYSLIRKGLIRINGKKTKENYHICNGDILNVAGFLLEKKIEKTPAPSVPGKKGLELENLIVFRNEHLLVINKPYDITVHGDETSLDVQVKNWFEANIQNNSLSFRPGPLHRLDRKTTGLLVFSLSNSGARWFTENIENHVIRKSYMGIMQGKFTEEEYWEDKICKKEAQGFVTVEKDELNGKTALTRAIPLKHQKFQEKDITLTQYDIETGRTHQIRAQSSLHGFPLLGDTAYEGKPLKNQSRDFYLHAWKLTFPRDNPLNLPETLICPPSKDFLFV